MRRGIDFTITLDDIPEVPATCPVLGIPMDSPSVDRKRNSLGYVPGNIAIISNRANMIKNDATAQELQAVLDYVVSIGDAE